MDDDIREDMEFSIRLYEHEIEALEGMEDDPIAGRGYLTDLRDGYLRHLMTSDREGFGTTRRERIKEARGKIRECREAAEQKQRRRDMDRAQSEAYDRWRRSRK